MEKKRRILGIPNRYYVLIFIILGIIAARFFPPVLPHIQLPAEVLVPLGGSFAITNTMVAMVIADIILLLLALAVRRATTSGELIPRGIAGAVEALLEVIYNLTESTAGKWSRTIFPWFATITLLVLVVNWTELIPGVDSIGLVHEVGHTEEVGASAATEGVPAEGQTTEAGPTAQEGEEEGAAEGHALRTLSPGIATITREEGNYGIIPFVRVLSTDLNFTVALALIAVFMVQVMGVRALGASYFTKFINVGGIFTRPIFGIIDFAVGILEMVSEISKILSFSFRLFGNIFAGSVLLFVIGFLVPVFAQSIFLMLEFFVGLIQAVVFGMLTMVFMAQATQGHGEHAEHQDEHQEDMPIEQVTI